MKKIKVEVETLPHAIEIKDAADPLATPLYDHSPMVSAVEEVSCGDIDAGFAEADIIVPVSLNSMASLRDTFLTCYLSQKNASFPSYELDGPFCDLVQKIWVEQIQTLQLVLGRDYWYQNSHPRLRAAHGALFLKELNVEEFLRVARRLEKFVEGRFRNL